MGDSALVEVVAEIYVHPHERELFPVVLSSHLCICRLPATEVNHTLQLCARIVNF